MTLEEKTGQLNQYSAGQPTGPGTHRKDYETMIAAGQVGSLLNVTRARSRSITTSGSRSSARGLHIPLLFGLDVIHGFRTIFPVNLGLSSTWDPALVEQTLAWRPRRPRPRGSGGRFPRWWISRATRDGAASRRAPARIRTSARCWREPTFVGIRGSVSSDPTSILACAKHFVGYGAAEAGRDYNTTEISERSLRQVYLRPFHASVEAGVGTIMSAFNALNGVPASANAFMLRDILRGEWGFRGLVVSDWGAVEETIAHGIAANGAAAARKSFLAGVDMDMESGLYVSELPGLVRSGAVPGKELDESVRRVLPRESRPRAVREPLCPARQLGAGAPARGVTPAGAASGGRIVRPAQERGPSRSGASDLAAGAEGRAARSRSLARSPTARRTCSGAGAPREFPAT